MSSFASAGTANGGSPAPAAGTRRSARECGGYTLSPSGYHRACAKKAGLMLTGKATWSAGNQSKGEICS